MGKQVILLAGSILKRKVLKDEDDTGNGLSAFPFYHLLRVRILFTPHASQLSPEKTMTEIGTRK